MGYLNPLRYRGYYYDEETGYYYLQSRYYDPEWKRFINADSTEVLSKENTAIESNIFVYCYNDPVNYIDNSGFKPATLEQYLRIKDKSSYPIHIFIRKNTIYISAYIDFHHKNRYKMNEIVSAIQNRWSGSYTVYGYRVRVKTTIINRSAKGSKIYSASQKFILFNSYSYAGVSCVKGGWSKSNPGKLYIYKGDSRSGKNHVYTSSEFAIVAAHEFGHLLGLADCYNRPKAIRNKYYSLMDEQWKAKRAQNIDISVVLWAFYKNKFQIWR